MCVIWSYLCVFELHAMRWEGDEGVRCKRVGKYFQQDLIWICIIYRKITRTVLVNCFLHIFRKNFGKMEKYSIWGIRPGWHRGNFSSLSSSFSIPCLDPYCQIFFRTQCLRPNSFATTWHQKSSTILNGTVASLLHNGTFNPIPVRSGPLWPWPPWNQVLHLQP